jgi:perosamine synthetase
MTNFQAAMINSQFQRFEAILEYKTKLADIYSDRLKHIKRIQLPVIPENKKHTWQSYQIIVDDFIDRDELIINLKKQGIGTNYGAQCMPYQKYFQEKYKLNCERLFPNALKAYEKGLVLPLYGKLEVKDIENVVFNLVELIDRRNA